MTTWASILGFAGAAAAAAAGYMSYRYICPSDASPRSSRLQSIRQSLLTPSLFSWKDVSIDEAIVAVPSKVAQKMLRCTLLNRGDRVSMLPTSAKLQMKGQIRLDPKKEKWMPFDSTALLSLHDSRTPSVPSPSLLWEASVRAMGPISIRGYDMFYHGAGELHWFIAGGLVQVVSAKGADVDRSAAGRAAMECVSFLPSLLLTDASLQWKDVDESSFVVTVPTSVESIEVTISIDSVTGRTRKVSGRRWCSEPISGKPRYVPFVVRFDESSPDVVLDGRVSVPSRFAAGWNFEADGEFFFFEAEILG